MQSKRLTGYGENQMDPRRKALIAQAPKPQRNLNEAKELAAASAFWLHAHGFNTEQELTLRNGRRPDVAAYSASGDIIMVEVKISNGDLQQDTKWPDYIYYCDGLYFCIGTRVKAQLVPSECGILISNGTNLECVRKPNWVSPHTLRKAHVMSCFNARLISRNASSAHGSPNGSSSQEERV
jgi:hypothetical protein